MRSHGTCFLISILFRNQLPASCGYMHSSAFVAASQLEEGLCNHIYWYLGQHFNNGSWCPNWDSADLIFWLFWTPALSTGYHGNCRWSAFLQFRTEISLSGHLILTELNFICCLSIARKLLYWITTFPLLLYQSNVSFQEIRNYWLWKTQMTEYIQQMKTDIIDS